MPPNPDYDTVEGAIQLYFNQWHRLHLNPRDHTGQKPFGRTFISAETRMLKHPPLDYAQRASQSVRPKASLISEPAVCRALRQSYRTFRSFAMPQPVAVAMPTSEEHAPLQLNLIPRLARKESHREMPAAIKAPPLTPVRVEPLRWSSASFSLSFLSNIDRLEINETVERNGVTYYVVEVYQFHYNSRLPTNVNNPRMAVTRLSDASESHEPDFRVERRYSDFAKLRHQIKLWTCPNAQFTCQYCYEYGRYMRLRLRQPRLLTSLSKNVEKRKDMLQEFMIDFVDLAQNPSKNTIHRCEAHQHVPALLESFLRD